MKSVLAVVLGMLCSSAFAQLTIPDTVKPYDKIVAGCNCIIPANGEASFEWTFSKSLQSEVNSDNTKAYLWGPPGTHSVSVFVVIRTYKIVLTVEPDEKDPSNKDKWVLKKTKVLNDVEWNHYDKTFTISGTPGPGPGPEPPPPGPGPPGPGPTDEYAKKVFTWLKLVPTNYYTKAKVESFANNYSSIAARAVATNDIQNLEGFLQATKLANANTINNDPSEADAWRLVLFEPLGKELSSLYKARNLQPNDKVGIGKLWQDTAAALKAAAY
jgi:hypothetical protein